MTGGSLCAVVDVNHMQEVGEKILQTTDYSGPTVAIPCYSDCLQGISIDLIGLLLLLQHCLIQTGSREQFTVYNYV